jgi:fumarylacetoacetate (FAA) hydrolase
MKLITYRAAGGGGGVGRLDGDAVQPLAAPTMIAWLEGTGTEPDGDPVSLDDVELLAPVPEPPTMRDFFTFKRHVDTVTAPAGGVHEAWYEAPVFYFSNPSTVRGPGAAVARPPSCEQLDFELEVAAVIDGRGEIAGFTLWNDWSARDTQAREMPVGVGPHKSKDFAQSLGPWLVTVDELPYEDGRLNVSGRVTVNGEEVTSSTAADQHFSWPEILAHAGRDSRLRAGDVLGSGTLGEGCLLEIGPLEGDRWIEPGDIVALEVDGLGRLETPIVAPG